MVNRLILIFIFVPAYLELLAIVRPCVGSPIDDAGKLKAPLYRASRDFLRGGEEDPLASTADSHPSSKSRKRAIEHENDGQVWAREFFPLSTGSHPSLAGTSDDSQASNATPPLRETPPVVSQHNWSPAPVQPSGTGQVDLINARPPTLYNFIGQHYNDPVVAPRGGEQAEGRIDHPYLLHASAQAQNTVNKWDKNDLKAVSDSEPVKIPTSQTFTDIEVPEDLQLKSPYRVRHIPLVEAYLIRAREQFKSLWIQRKFETQPFKNIPLVRLIYEHTERSIIRPSDYRGLALGTRDSKRKFAVLFRQVYVHHSAFIEELRIQAIKNSAFIEKLSNYAMGNYQEPLLNWIYAQIFHPTGSFPIFGIFETAPHTAQYQFRPAQIHLLKYFSAENVSKIKVLSAGTLIGLWYKETKPEFWRVFGGEDSKFWKVMQLANEKLK